MSLLDTLAGVFRPRVAGAAGERGAVAAAPAAGLAGAPAAAITAEPDRAIGEVEEREPSEKEKALMLHLSNVSHGVNHFQTQMLTMLYAPIMAELGLNYADIAVLSAVRSVVNSAAQGGYGFLTPFMSRCKILGIGNMIMALGTLLSGLSLNLPTLIFARCVAALGSSAQHPVGYSILSSYFPKARGAILAMNTSASNVGTFIATPLATALLLIMGWREVFYVVTVASLVMGGVYLLFRDYGAPTRSGSGRSRLAQGFGSYLRVMKNRNMMIIALVFMIGAAGAEGGITQTYFAPYLQNDLGYSTLMVGILISSLNLGRIVGPLIFGHLSDRLDRIRVLQTSLFLSAVGTLFVAYLGVGDQSLVLGLPITIGQLTWLGGLFLYSSFTTSRGTLTQTIVADAASDQDRDAAFSLYFTLGFLAQPFWLLVTGYLMDNFGFTTAIERTTVSYLIGALLLFLLKDPRRLGRAAA